MNHRETKVIKVGHPILSESWCSGSQEVVKGRPLPAGLLAVVIDDKLPPELSDMSSTLTKVKALKPDIFVVSGHAKGAMLAWKFLDGQIDPIA